MDNQEKLLKQIKSLSDSIRRKNRALKMNISERDQFLESTFKPITETLKKSVSKEIGKPSIHLEGDVILPISKFEEQFKEETEEDVERSEYSEESEYMEETEEGGKTEESEQSEGVVKEKDNLEESGDYGEFTTSPSNLSKLGTDIMFKGPLGRQYLLKMLHSSLANRKYHTYGARVEDNGLMVGDSKLDVDENDNIIIGGKKYAGTRGLFELIFKNNPAKYTKKDLNLFKNILENTNAHRKKYSKEFPIHRNTSVKYQNIISNLFPPQMRPQLKRRALSSAELNILHKKRRTTTKPTNITSGKGLLKSLYNTNVIYYNDINKLVNRMRLLYEAMEAGHTGLDNEWVALVDELQNRGVIGY